MHFNIMIPSSSLFIFLIESWQNAGKLVKACILALPCMLTEKHTCSRVKVQPSIPCHPRLAHMAALSYFICVLFIGLQLDPLIQCESVLMLAISCMPWKLMDVLIKTGFCSWL